MSPLDLFFSFLVYFWRFVWAWWWVVVPFLLFQPARFLWLWWRNDSFSNKNPYILLEIRIPPDVVKPMKAMEYVFESLWQLYDPPNPRERWIDGQDLLPFQIEVASIEGQVHFYIRIPKGSRKLVESSIYAQYPTAEMNEVDDYTKRVPQDIPNKEWRLWAANMKLARPSMYPIRTLSRFFEEREAAKEEKRIDPITLMIEAFSRIGEGEQIWFQIFANPIIPGKDGMPDILKEGKGVVDELVKRPAPEKNPGVKGDFMSVMKAVATGVVEEKKKEESAFLSFPEMTLTAGERDVISAIEEKLSKKMFLCFLRFIYLAKRDKYFGAMKAMPFTYLNQFAAQHMNYFVPMGTTKVYTFKTWFMDKRRNFLRQRRFFRLYANRLAPGFPSSGAGTFILNSEELATLFHFPSQAIMPRTGTESALTVRKGAAPAGLPVDFDDDET